MLVLQPSYLRGIVSKLFCCCCCTRKNKSIDGKEDDEDNSIMGNTASSVSDDNEDESNTKEFVFLQNSYKMYVDVCNLSPKPFRHYTRDSLKKGMKKYAIYADEDVNHTGLRNVITEDIMYIVVKEVTPKKYLKQALDILDKDRTTK